MILFDLDETLVRTVKKDSFDERDLVYSEDYPAFDVKVGGDTYDVYLRPDAWRLKFRNIPFTIFSAGDKQYVRAIAKKLSRISHLNVRGWLSRLDMSHIGPSTPLTEEPVVLIDDRYIYDPVVRHKLGRFPNALFLRINAFDSNKEGEIEINRSPLSKPLYWCIDQALEYLGVDQDVFPKQPLAILSKPASY